MTTCAAARTICTEYSHRALYTGHTGLDGAPLCEPTFSTALTTSMPSSTCHVDAAQYGSRRRPEWAGSHLAEDNVLAVEPRRLHSADEELRAVGPRPRVGHREHALARVLELEVLVGELLAVDRLAASAVAIREISSLRTDARAKIGAVRWCHPRGEWGGGCARTCSMKLGMMRWKEEPLKWSGLPDLPLPFSPVARARKFSTCDAVRALA